MKRTATLLLLFCCITVSYPQIAVRGETVHTMAGKPLKNALILIKGTRIEQVLEGAAAKLPEGYKLMDARVVTPGLVDAHSVVGLAGIFNQRHDQMQLELSEPVQPELRAIDAYNPHEQLVEFVRKLGITTLHTGHAPGALASGTTVVVRTAGNTINQALIDSGMVAFTFGEDVSRNYKSPGTSAKAVAMMRSEFLKAKDYLARKNAKDPDKRPAPDLKLEMLARVLRGEKKVIFTAHTATDIMAALRVRKEFGFKMVLDGAAEAYLVVDEIKKAGVPVILHPTMERAGGETRNVSFETAAKLQQAGILFAIQGGYESYVPKTRIVLYEAAVAAANGLPFEAALAAITINAARIIGVDKRVGSIEKGKDADLVLFDGDPFEYTTHVCGVVINGSVVSETCK